jgi:DNA modification methylase
VVLIYSTDDGIALWAHAEDAAEFIEPGSVKLVLTSPPYPVVSRAYGRFTVPEWLHWMRRLAEIWKGLITEDGTIAINLMDVFVGGAPTLSPYIERFMLSAIDDVGLQLAGRMMWHSTNKLGHIEWAAKRRVVPKNTLEHLLLFSRSDRPAWNADRMERKALDPAKARKRA